MTESKLSPVEFVVTVRGEEQSFKKKYLVYDKCACFQEDEVVKTLIEDARKECKFDIEEIKIKAIF